MGDIFQRKMKKIFMDMSNTFCSADDIFIVGYFGSDADYKTTL